MYCAACAITIEDALKRLPGVSDVHVQGATQRARLSLDPARSRLSDVIKAVQVSGYRAWPDASVRALGERRVQQRQLLWRLLVAWFCMMQVMMITTAQYVAGPAEIPGDIWRLMNWAAWVLSLPVLLFSCRPFFAGAWAALKAGRISMDTPVALGIVAMFGVSSGVTFGHTQWLGTDAYFDSLTMFVAFLLTGRWLESRAREKVTQSLEALSGRLPEAVERAVEAGRPDHELFLSQVESAPLSSLRPGDRVRVAPGQAFPADGQVLWGRTEVDESLLTGESRPVQREPGQLVVAGSLNLSSPVWCRIERLGPDTRYQQIVELVHQALTEKPGWMRAADRFAGPFLWAVLATALLGGLAWMFIEPSKAIWVAVSVLVVTCPCALSLAAPSALLAAAGGLAKVGVLVRRLEAIEALAQVRTLLFDKTGTLTDPQLQVAEVWWDGQGHPWPGQGPWSSSVRAAAALANHSHHPLSRALASLGPAETDDVWSAVMERAGQGLEGIDRHGHRWRLGSASWALLPAGLADLAAAWPVGRAWFVRQDQPGRAYTLGFAFDERLRPHAHQTMAALRTMEVRVELLSGDQEARVVALARQFDPPIPVARAAASPEEKLLELQGRQQGDDKVGVVGDGINDAPVLAQAQVSFALDQGAALAQSQADFIVLGGRLDGIPKAMAVARKAQAIVRQNLIWAATYNFVCIPLALMGYLPPWLAGIGMALSSLGVLLNALRLGNPD